jgi:replicative DNA helicase
VEKPVLREPRAGVSIALLRMVQDASNTPLRPMAATSPGPTGRMLPHSLEAEEYLLSCCLLDGADVVARCLEAKITPEAFYDSKHGIVFAQLVDLYNRQVTIDVSVVAEDLKTARKLDQIGGYAFLAQVSSRIPTTAQAGYFIEKVREQALLREIIRAATGAVEECYGFSGGIDEFVDQVEQ